MSDHRALRAATSLLLVGLLGLTGCSGDGPSLLSGDDSPSDEPSESEPVLSPLTGLELAKAPRRPVLTVKMDNSSSSAPQVGLAQADLVTEELVEGGITRLAVSYYASIPTDVGPVRSMRATDIGIVQPLAATLVTSGGAAQTVARVREAGIKVLTEGSPGFYRETSRSAPYNLFVKLGELARTVRAKKAPESYLPFSQKGDLPKGRRATGVTASFSGGHETIFESAGKTWTNTNSNAGAEDQFTPDTVLVLRVEVGDAGYLDPAGNPVPETMFTGTGPAQIFHRGRVVAGTWSKDGLDDTISLSAKGKDVSLPAGKVWLELVPADGGSVTVTP